MAIAARCEACDVQEIAATPGALHEFFARHRDPDDCAQLRGYDREVSIWLAVPPPRRSA